VSRHAGHSICEFVPIFLELIDPNPLSLRSGRRILHNRTQNLEGRHMLESYRPPTDVLYKFMAIAGLVIAVAAGWRWTTIQLHEHRLQMLVIGKVHNLTQDMDKIMERDVEKALSQLRLEGVELTGAAVSARFEKISAANPLASPLGDPDIDRLYQEFRAVQIDKEAEQFILIDAALPFGCALMFFGFSLWYSKVQRPLDIILQAQAAEAIRKIKAG
jgi:hypothetical protein